MEEIVRAKGIKKIIDNLWWEILGIYNENTKIWIFMKNEMRVFRKIYYGNKSDKNFFSFMKRNLISYL
jgi:hypothetical protein